MTDTEKKTPYDGILDKKNKKPRKKKDVTEDKKVETATPETNIEKIEENIISELRDWEDEKADLEEEVSHAVEEIITETQREPTTLHSVSEDNIKGVFFNRQLAKKPFTEKEKQLAFYYLTGLLSSVKTSLDNNQEVLDDDNPSLEKMEWAASIERAENAMPFRDELAGVGRRPNSTWEQMINTRTEGQPMIRGPINDKLGKSPIKNSNRASEVLARITNMLELGNVSYIPLFHTGIWIRLRTPSTAAIARLDEIITSEKAQYGTQTRGEIFSNENVILRRHVANFILDHVTYSTAPDGWDKEYLKSIIKVTDLDEMMRGIMQTRYPDGYPFRQPCTANPKECQHVVEGTLDLREIQWTDTSALTDYQKKIMENMKRPITQEQLERYQEEFADRRTSRVVLTSGQHDKNNYDEITGEVINGVVINIETPTLEKDEEYGIRWVNVLTRDLNETLGEKASAKERREFLAKRTSFNYLRTYAQWIKSIEIYEGGELFASTTDQEELEELFEYISSSFKYVLKFREGVEKHAERCIVHMVGIKNYECPNCGKKHETREGNFHLIVPIDMLSAFFILVRSSVLRSINMNDI